MRPTLRYTSSSEPSVCLLLKPFEVGWIIVWHFCAPLSVLALVWLRLHLLYGSRLPVSMAHGQPTAWQQPAAHREAKMKSFTSTSPYFDMYVVSLQDVLNMTALPVHEDLISQGILVVFLERPGHAAIFVSHQWAGQGHPDPDFEQFQVLQSFLSRLTTGKIAAISGNILAELYLEKPRIPSKELRSYELSVWYDYFSVPQAETAVEERKMAIQSVWDLVADPSSFFGAVVVPKEPSNSTAHISTGKARRHPVLRGELPLFRRALPPCQARAGRHDHGQALLHVPWMV